MPWGAGPGRPLDFGGYEQHTTRAAPTGTAVGCECVHVVSPQTIPEPRKRAAGRKGIGQDMWGAWEPQRMGMHVTWMVPGAEVSEQLNGRPVSLVYSYSSHLLLVVVTEYNQLLLLGTKSRREQVLPVLVLVVPFGQCPPSGDDARPLPDGDAMRSLLARARGTGERSRVFGRDHGEGQDG